MARNQDCTIYHVAKDHTCQKKYVEHSRDLPRAFKDSSALYLPLDVPVFFERSKHGLLLADKTNSLGALNGFKVPPFTCVLSTFCSKIPCDYPSFSVSSGLGVLRAIFQARLTSKPSREPQLLIASSEQGETKATLFPRSADNHPKHGRPVTSENHINSPFILVWEELFLFLETGFLAGGVVSFSCCRLVAVLRDGSLSC